MYVDPWVRVKILDHNIRTAKAATLDFIHRLVPGIAEKQHPILSHDHPLFRIILYQGLALVTHTTDDFLASDDLRHHIIAKVLFQKCDSFRCYFHGRYTNSG